ncbi:MAG: (2Fe-2S) ferredoxin domain-containing protein [Bacillota bacterium]|jgi:NADP-reducing hydrogenase subunit HndB|nr:(2Fe-2S) ferredoxin domain-containing protein [Bacillota bacterium]HOB41875.1 (2Fe-2S) ferredoxin domain-containing protein [Bacillota bacterium]HOK70381.1 (2Fe-2S) ferredoxin domain-containing protein [Bacillota bacterium]HOO29717.1 (2Fe-2S) ferredoxin domain-containing protein [Bacillota bacterium]HPQ03459.1 (2Fe-2S) ferredoxin domain-containing protein [Bacillota bacterium]
MKSLDDLKKIKERAQAMTELREGNEEVRIVIGMGTCGIAAGARDTLAAVVDEINTRNLRHVAVTQTGCIGMCEYEPIVDVIRQGEPKVTYGRVTPEKARQIIASHVVNGQVVGDLVISSK